MFHEVEDHAGGDERMAALVQAVPHLRALGLINYHSADTATDAGAAMHVPAVFNAQFRAVQSSLQ